MPAGRDPGLRQAGLRQAGDAKPAPDQTFSTKVQRVGAAGSTAHNTYDLLYPWSLAQNFSGWGVSGGATDPINVLNAYPMVFPIGCSIKDILIKNNIGAPATKYLIAIYSNLAAKTVYPGSKILANAEISPLPTGITTWAVNLSVAPGTILWMVNTCDNNAAGINLSGMGQTQHSANVIMGIPGALTSDPLVGWQMAQTYNSTLPTTFPTGTPTALVSSSHTMPAFFIRYA